MPHASPPPRRPPSAASPAALRQFCPEPQRLLPGTPHQQARRSASSREGPAPRIARMSDTSVVRGLGGPGSLTRLVSGQKLSRAYANLVLIDGCKGQEQGDKGHVLQKHAEAACGKHDMGMS